MENVNIGVANLMVSNRLKESFFNDKLIEESRKVTTDFFDVVKDSPVLQLEFKVYNNIEGKHIENEVLAKEYIDNHIKLFEVYTIEEIDAEHQKLDTFINENKGEPMEVGIIEMDKIKLYDGINTLVTESLKLSEDVDVDAIHEAFSFVLNHVKLPRKALLENVDVEPVNEDVLEIAVEKFNEKYADLNEEDRELLKTLIKSSSKEKEALLETMKSENIAILEGSQNDSLNDGITKAIQKIKEMVYNAKNVDDDILGLHTFKKEFL